jgi:outer membrane receptor protein involved in Fe transport
VYDKRIQAYSATLAAKVGGVNLTTLSGYSINSLSDSYDFSDILGSYTLKQFGVSGTPLVEHRTTRKFSQEIRLSSSLGAAFDWLVGVFYTHEDTQYVQDVLAADPFTGLIVGQWNDDSFPTTYQEYAVFGDATFHLSDRVDIQFGGRESQNRQTYMETITGDAYTNLFYALPSPVINPEVSSKDNAFTYLITPQFKVSPSLMVYARLASGYRPGGPNPTSTVFVLPPRYSPDKTQNYEIGAKGDFLNRTFSIDASLYYISWKDVQLQLTDPVSGNGYFANAGKAKSQGLELSIQAKPLPGLTLSSWVVWNDAELTEPFPANSLAYGVSGDRLPYSSRFSGNLSIEDTFPLTANVVGSIAAEVSYVGDRQGVFQGVGPTAPLPRQTFPAYAKTDLRAGLRYDSWSVNAFVTNVTDRRGVLTGGLGTFNPVGFSYIQPRTVGVFLIKTF